MHWKSVAIIGVGLIGGSLGLALRRAGLADEIVGVGRRAASLRAAEKIGAVTRATTDLAEGVADCELIVVCSPVHLVAEHVRDALQHAPTAIVTDAGSTKRQILDEVRKASSASDVRRFVGGHPIAGGERNGPAAARAELFEDRLVVLTPARGTDPRAVATVEALWQQVGARTLRMSAAAHDRILAATSHTPHVIAAALAAATRDEDLPFTGSGWADTTRIAAGDVELWCQILDQNRAHVLKSLDKFAKVLANFRSALEEHDARKLVRLLTAGKKQRDSLGS